MSTVGTVIINVKADTAKLVSGMDRAERTVSRSVENIKKSLYTMAGAYLGFQGATKAYDAVIKSGFAYNMQLEESKAGLVALSVAIKDSHIPIMERYASANREATSTLAELQKINADTPHTLNQTNQIYKAMYVSMKNAGASTSDLITLTKKISIAAGAGGIEFNSLLAGVDGLATGTVLANSDLGRFLSSLGLTNKALKESKDIVKLINERLNSFKAPDTMRVALSNLEVQWNQLTGEITKTSFEEAKNQIKQLSDAISGLKDDVPIVIDTAKQIVEVATSLGIATFAMKSYSATTIIMNSVTATSTVLAASELEAKTLGTQAITLKTLADKVNTTGMINNTVATKSQITALNLEAATAQKAALAQTEMSYALNRGTIASKAFSAATKAIPYVALATGIYSLIELFPKITSETTLAEQAMNDFADSVKNASTATLDFEISKITKELARVSKLANEEARKRGINSPVSGYGETLAYESLELSKQLDILNKQKEAIKKKNDATKDSISEVSSFQKQKTEEQLKAEKKIWAGFSDDLQTQLDSIEYELPFHLQIDEADLAAKTKAIEDLSISSAQKQADAYLSIIEGDKTPLETLNLKQIDQFEIIKKGWGESSNMMQKYYKIWNKEQENLVKSQKGYDGIGSKDWTAGLTGQAKSIANIENSFADLGKEQSKWAKYSQENTASEKDKNKHLENQLALYGNVAGAIGNMSEEGSKAAAAMQVAQTALAVVQGVSAIVNQGSGDPYTAIPRMIAMTAMVASTLSQAGIAFNGSASTDFTRTIQNPNTTTVFGGGDEVSKSIENSVSNISDYAKPQYKAILNMANSLENLSDNLKGLSADIVRNGNFGVGVGATEYQKSYEKTNSLANGIGTTILTGGIGLIVDKLTGGFVGNLVGKTLGAFGLGGGGYNWSKLQNSGIAFGSANGVGDGTVRSSNESYYGGANSQAKLTSQSLDQLIKSMKGLQFQTQAYESSSKSFWGSASYSYSSSTSYKSLGSELSDSISQIFKNIKDTTLQEADIFGKDISSKLGAFKIDIGNINLKGLTGKEIEEKINQTFSTEADKITTAMFGTLLSSYRKIGEGAFETASRVATDITVTTKLLEQSGKSLSDSLDKMAFSENLINVFGGLDKLSDSMSNFVDNFFTDAEKLDITRNTLVDYFKSLNIEMPKTNEEFKKLVKGVDLSTVSGKELYKALLDVSGTFADIGKAFNDNFKAQRSNELELSKLKLDLQKSEKDAVTQAFQTIQSLTNGISSSLNATIDSLRGNAQGKSLANLAGYITQAQTAVNNADYDGLNSIAKDITSSASALNDSSLFSSSSEQKFAQLSTASSLENIDNSMLDQVDYLKIIADGVTDGAITKNTANTTSSVDAINTALETYNKSITDALGVGGILEFSDFQAGGTLNNADEIAFRQSFTADSASSFSGELGSLRDNLAYMSLDSTNSFDVFKNIRASSSSDANNILEFFKSTGTQDSSIYNGLAKEDKQAYLNGNLSLNDYMKKQPNGILTSAEKEATSTLKELGITSSNLESTLINLPSADNKSRFRIGLNGALTDWIVATSYNTKNAAGSVRVSDALNMTPNELETALKTTMESSSNYYKNHPINADDIIKLPQFATGTPKVPHDMLAQIHQDEMIIPQTFSDGLRNGDLQMGDNSEVVKVVKELITVVEAQANEMRELRKDTQDQNYYLASIEEKIA